MQYLFNGLKTDFYLPKLNTNGNDQPQCKWQKENRRP
jgi:hypothetical protein